MGKLHKGSWKELTPQTEEGPEVQYRIGKCVRVGRMAPGKSRGENKQIALGTCEEYGVALGTFKECGVEGSRRMQRESRAASQKVFKARQRRSPGTLGGC